MKKKFNSNFETGFFVSVRKIVIKLVNGCGIPVNIVQFFEVVYNIFFLVIAGNSYGQ